MRLPKYRAWHKVQHWLLPVREMTFNRDGEAEDVAVTGISHSFMASELELMQSIGNTDEDGNDIYDGDLLSNGTRRVCQVVKLESPAFCGWDLSPINNGGKWNYDRPWNDVVICGNIYEGIRNRKGAAAQSNEEAPSESSNEDEMNDLVGPR